MNSTPMNMRRKTPIAKAVAALALALLAAACLATAGAYAQEGADAQGGRALAAATIQDEGEEGAQEPAPAVTREEWEQAQGAIGERDGVGAWTRVWGENRYATSAALSGAWDGEGAPSTFLIATGTDFADALAGSGLAGLEGASVLLTEPDALSPEARRAIVATLELQNDGTVANAGGTRCIILGGEEAVSPAVADELAAILGAEQVGRVCGEDRQQTAVAIYGAGEGWSNTAFVASGASPYDALSASAYAAAANTPVFLCDGDGTLGEAAMEALDSGAFRCAIIVGGTAVVSQDAQDWLDDHLGSANVMRLAGADRYETSSKIANWSVGLDNYYSSGKSARLSPAGKFTSAGLVVASGEDGHYIDALSAGPFCARTGKPLLLLSDELEYGYGMLNTVSARVANPTDDSVENASCLIGGTAVFSDDVFTMLTTSSIRGEQVSTMAGGIYAFYVGGSDIESLLVSVPYIYGETGICQPRLLTSTDDIAAFIKTLTFERVQAYPGMKYINSDEASALARYDDAFFAEHDLVCVYQSVSSGSYRPVIGPVKVEGGTCDVALTIKVPDGAVTCDAAGWRAYVPVAKGSVATDGITSRVVCIW